MPEPRDADTEFINGLSDQQWRQWVGLTLVTVTNTGARIEKQVQRTNGRVTSLEKFRWGLLGGFTVITAVIVPIFIHLVTIA